MASMVFIRVHKAAAKRQDNEDVYDEVDGEESLRLEFMFPFCVEDYDVVGICCHIDEEHAVEVKNGELGRQVPLMDKIDDKEKGYYGIEEFVANRLEVVSRLSWLKGVRLEDKASAAGVAANAYWRKKGCVDWWEKLDASTRKNVFRVILGKSAKSLGLSLLFAEHLGESIKK